MIDSEKKAAYNRGSAFVEAAIMLPVFIIAVVTVCWLIKLCFLQTVIFDTAAEQVRRDSVSIVPFGSAGLSGNIKSALDDNGIDSSGFSEKLSLSGFSKSGMSDMQRFRFTFDSKIAIPAPIVKSVDLENQIVYRRWQGEEHNRDPFGFENMQTNERGRAVYIFPRAGQKYHKLNCRYVNSYYEVTLLSPAIREKYDPCPLCTEGDEADGQAVCIFKYGSAYHESDCNAVKKFVLCIDESDAELKGYTPCSVCGG